MPARFVRNVFRWHSDVYTPLRGVQGMFPRFDDLPQGRCPRFFEPPVRPLIVGETQNFASLHSMLGKLRMFILYSKAHAAGYNVNLVPILPRAASLTQR